MQNDFIKKNFFKGFWMSDMTNTGINSDITREIKGYCPSRAKALSDGTYDLNSISMSFEEACLKLAAFRKGKTLSLQDDQGLEFEIENDDEPKRN